MQIPILNGIYTDIAPDFRVSYPVNYLPIALDNGISKGYLRPADGIEYFTDGLGVDRGSILWNGIMYRVSGTRLISISDNGDIFDLGDVGGDGYSPVRMVYSFDRLAIVSGGKLYYYNGAINQVTDEDLGLVLDVEWVDGYFMPTDGTNLIVTELNNPFTINLLKYGSSEVDPDPIKGVLKVRNEIHALNRYTIEVFDNVGGELFPFQRVDGAQIQKGSVGTFTKCLFLDACAFMGSGRNENISIYLAQNGQTQKLATTEIDRLLSTYNELDLANCYMESVIDKGQNLLYVHLPDRTLVYNYDASQAVGDAVWYVLTSSISGFSKYRGRYITRAYNKWFVGDVTSEKIGTITDKLSSHFGDDVRWEFGTTIVYNQSAGAIFNQLELVALTGSASFGENPTISTQYSVDGITWSQLKTISAGKRGERAKRLVFFQQGMMKNWRIQRFIGDSQAHMSFARLEAQLEPLAW